MPENEFEKKVSSELQGLKFKPSETVWMKVEERIREKKKRRVFIIFFLFVGIALLGYWQWGNIFGTKKSELVKKEIPVSGKSNNPNNDIQKKTEEDKQDDDRTTETKSGRKNNDNGDEKVPAIDNRSLNKIDNTVSKNDQLKVIIEKKEKTLVSPEQKKKKLYITKGKLTTDQKREFNLTERDLADLTVDQTVLTKDTSNIKRTDADNKKQDTEQKLDKPLEVETEQSRVDSVTKKDDIKKDSIIKKADTVSKVIPVDSPIVSIPKKPGTTNKKWKLGIDFTPGISSYNENIFSLSTQKSANFNASPGTVNGAGPAPPSKANSGFGFQLGGYVKKQFNRSGSMSIGFRWAYYSDKLYIGTRTYPTASSSFSQTLNSLGVNSAYRANGNTSSYKEKYHFIELPLNYQVRMNKSSFHPLSLLLGFKIGKLLASNAIVYDTVAGGIYYKSTKYLNKTQFGFTGGFSWKINKSDKIQITAGPALDFHLNSLTDNPLDKKKYLLFTGLRTSVNFKSGK